MSEFTSLVIAISSALAILLSLLALQRTARLEQQKVDRAIAEKAEERLRAIEGQLIELNRDVSWMRRLMERNGKPWTKS